MVIHNNYMVPEKPFKKIVIQNLQQRPQIEGSTKQPLDFIKVLDRHCRVKQIGQVYYYKDSGEGTQRLLYNQQFQMSHFFNAFASAYTQHGDIVLIPDQIWLMIISFISKYINQNAEKLRQKVVRHEGVKTLQIIQESNSVQQSLQMERNWDNFFLEVIKAIEKETLGGVVNGFMCDFSTTNLTYRTISTAMVMNSMKQFFKYKRRINLACGINNVYMAGIREDWQKMIPKLQYMNRFDIDGQIKNYTSHMKTILIQFLNTFDEKPNVEWWNTIMTTPQKRVIYLQQKLLVEGWILNFFGLYEKVALKGFPQMNIEVPIKLINELTKTEKEVLLVSDWVSVSKIDERTYKPDIGIAIIEEKK